MAESLLARWETFASQTLTSKSNASKIGWQSWVGELKAEGFFLWVLPIFVKAEKLVFQARYETMFFILL